MRAAIQEANALTGTNTILLPAGSYKLTLAGSDENAAVTGDLDIYGELNLLGQGADVIDIDGNSLDRVLHMPTITTTVVISGVKIHNGRAPENFGGGIAASGQMIVTRSIISNNSARFGGGIHGLGTMWLLDSSVLNNTATTTDSFIGGIGGGINVIGTLIMERSTINNNRAEYSVGGGIFNQGTVQITASTIGNNSADRGGGGIMNVKGPGVTPTDGEMHITNSTIHSNESSINGGGLANGATLFMRNSTISSNLADRSGGGLENYLPESFADLSQVTIAHNVSDNDHNLTGVGGGVRNLHGKVIIRGTLIADNRSRGLAHVSCQGTMKAIGANVVADYYWPVFLNCYIGGDFDRLLTTIGYPMPPLADNGGPTLTHALYPGTIAVNVAGMSVCHNYDQRSRTRVSTSCSAGAYQFGIWLVGKHQIGSPGSTFSFTGYDFPPTSTASITVNGANLGNTPTDSRGKVSFDLSTTLADEGAYFVTAAVNPSATEHFVIDNSALLRPPSDGGDVFDVPAGIAFTKFNYLPMTVTE